MLPAALRLTMDLKKLAQYTEPLRAAIPAPWLAVGATVLAVGGVALPLVLKRLKARRAKAPAAPGVVSESARAPAPDVRRLRRAWRRFLKALPPEHRRSILSFEHFVVLGPASSGKSTLIDSGVDWRRQAKQSLPSQVVDPDLQVFIGSGVVVSELPAQLALDATEDAHKALWALWAPLYRHRAPTVVLVLDLSRLGQQTAEDLRDEAERLRGKVNVLSRVRGGPVELRLALTHLDTVDGYDAWVDFCREQGLPAHVPFLEGEGAASRSEQLRAWLDGVRAHLSRALVTTSSPRFRQVVGFLRALPDTLPPVATFLDGLLAEDRLAPSPRFSGVYFASQPLGEPNPLAWAADRGPGPDPHRPHVFGSAAVSALLVGLMGTAYAQQLSRFHAAEAALRDYDPSALGGEREAQRRAEVRAFAFGDDLSGLFRPPWFRHAQQAVRAEYSRRVREKLLIPRLRTVARQGAIDPEAPAYPWRRSLHYLGLIHSVREDDLHVKDNLDVWTKMTELPEDVIRDYLRGSETRFVGPVSFELGTFDTDTEDSAKFWVDFLESVESAVAAGALRKEELEQLRQRASTMSESIDRFEHDDITRDILKRLGDATEWGASRDPQVARMREVYQGQFEVFLANVAASDVRGQRRPMQDILTEIQRSRIDVPEVSDLRGLVARLESLYATPAVELGLKAPAVVDAAGRKFTFDPKVWAGVLREGAAAEALAAFLEKRATGGSIFGFGTEAELPPIRWNASNEGRAIFLGQGLIRGPYTRAAYEKYVRDVVVRLEAVLSKTQLPADEREALSEFVLEQVRDYAAQYRAQLDQFQASFHVAVASVEELRVLLGQMTGPTSAFADFTKVVESQTLVQADLPPATSEHPSLLRPMVEALEDYVPLKTAINGAGGAPELEKYREILRQLLAKLSADPTAGRPDPAAPPAGLVEALSPAGRLVLQTVSGDAGSYAAMVRQWLDNARIPAWQSSPFSAPVEFLSALGLRDLQQTIQGAWEREAMKDLRSLTERYPFDPKATADVSVSELDAFLHPQRGRLADVIQRWFVPVTELIGAKTYRELPGLRGKVEFPPRMFAVLGAARGLSSTLWDATGTAAPLDFKVATLPLEKAKAAEAIPTLEFFTVGDVTVFNFNQKPAVTTIRFDWTRDQPAQVGAQLTALDTKESRYPAPYAFEGSHWNLLRMLAAAQDEAFPQVSAARKKSWWVGKGVEQAKVSFLVYGQLEAPFTELGTLVRGRASVQAVAGGKP